MSTFRDSAEYLEDLRRAWRHLDGLLMARRHTLSVQEQFEWSGPVLRMRQLLGVAAPPVLPDPSPRQPPVHPPAPNVSSPFLQPRLRLVTGE